MSPTQRDTRLLFMVRSLRAFAFGYLSVLLALYLPRFGFNAIDLGLYLSGATLSGIAVNFFAMRVADRIGRRRLLAISAALIVLSGIALAAAENPYLLIVAAVFGAVPPGGNGAFSTVEQAMIGNYAQESRASVFGNYGLWASAAGAIGVLAAGMPDLLVHLGLAVMAGYRLMMVLYAAIGAVIVILASSMSGGLELWRRASAEPQHRQQQTNIFGLGRSHKIMMRMGALFVADSFGSAMVTTSLLAYFLYMHFHIGASVLALLFFGTRLLATVSYPLAVFIAKHIGLINTAVFTHIPSSMLLIAVPFMPTATLAAILLLLRGLLVQMDVPTRQAYISAIVDPEERAAAAGVTTLGRQTGQLAGPAIGGIALSMTTALAFLVAGGVKMAYDLALWFSFRNLNPDTDTSQKA